MKTLQELRNQIQTVLELDSVVSTMKSLAVVNIQQFEKAINTSNEYQRTIEMGLQIVLHSAKRSEKFTKILKTVIPKPKPEPTIKKLSTKGNSSIHPRLGAVILGSDQGMVGQFNRQIVDYALQTMDHWRIPVENRVYLVVGKRAASVLQQKGQALNGVLEVPNTTAGINSLVQELVVRISGWRENWSDPVQQSAMSPEGSDMERIILYYNKPVNGSMVRDGMTSTRIMSMEDLVLWPISSLWLTEIESRPWPRRVIPFFRLEWSRLFAALLREYLFVSIYRAVAESMKSENASRLSTMQAAETNIDERLDELNHEFRHLRQSSITDELLDLISGFEVIKRQT